MAIRTAHENDIAARKRVAAAAAVAEIEDGMLVGLGTGSTANFAIAALGERVAEGLKVTTVATSLATARVAEAAGLPVLPFDTFARLDIAIDGADELDPQLRAIKGKGGAMLREKIVAAAAERMIVIVDAGKQVTQLGRGPLPVEVLPFAAGFVSDRIERLGATVRRKIKTQSPFTFAGTSEGGELFDAWRLPFGRGLKVPNVNLARSHQGQWRFY